MPAPVPDEPVQSRASHSDASSKAGIKEYEATAADLIRPDKEMTYVSLHHHSTYS